MLTGKKEYNLLVKTVFLGTPAIAVPFLELLHQKSQVAAVLTNPDQPAGRGYELRPSPIKETALRLNLSLFQPPKADDPGFLDAMRNLSPEAGIVVAYGKLLPSSLLQIPKHGFLNVHFSLLPAYRGAAPIQWALINGETETGVTLFWLDEGMDTGPIFSQRRIPIAPEDDAESLRPKLVALGVEMLSEALAQLSNGRKDAVPQASAPVSKARILKREDGLLDWSQPACSLFNRLRGVTPWPGAYVMLEHGGRPQRLKILKAQAVSGREPGEPGIVVRLDAGEGFVIKCSQDFLKITLVQPEGKKAMSAWDFWQGAHLKLGEKLR